MPACTKTVLQETILQETILQKTFPRDSSRKLTLSEKHWYAATEPKTERPSTWRGAPSVDCKDRSSPGGANSVPRILKGIVFSSY